jgi:hypothetical protein
MVITEEKLNKLLKVYLVFILLELFLLGSGQLIKYHSLTLRMVNFVLLTLFCLLLFRKRKIKAEYMMMLYVFLGSITLSSVIGYFNGASLAPIFNDVKPLLFFIYLIPFSFLIKTNADLKRVISIIKISAIILAVLYFIYIIVFQFYPLVIFVVTPLEMVGELFFRGSGGFFFYKGFFFIMVSIFLITKQSKIDKLILSILLVAILFTLTRGFYLALILPYLIVGMMNLYYSGRIKLSNMILLVLFLLIFGLSLPSILNFIGNKSLSDAIRIDFINKVNDNITPLSMIFGHGFGVAAGVNRVHLEISYYEILHKQGIVGLVVYFIPLIYCFNKLIKDSVSKLDQRFFLAVLSVYIISFTNPFINNPLGLSIIVISMIAMDIISKENQRMVHIPTL